MLQHTMPHSVHPASNCPAGREAGTYYLQTLEGYNHAMQVYTQTQIWTLVGLDGSQGIGSGDSSDITPVLHHQGPGPPGTPKTEEAE